MTVLFDVAASDSSATFDAEALLYADACATKGKALCLPLRRSQYAAGVMQIRLLVNINITQHCHREHPK